MDPFNANPVDRSRIYGGSRSSSGDPQVADVFDAADRQVTGVPAEDQHVAAARGRAGRQVSDAQAEDQHVAAARGRADRRVSSDSEDSDYSAVSESQAADMAAALRRAEGLGLVSTGEAKPGSLPSHPASGSSPDPTALPAVVSRHPSPAQEQPQEDPLARLLLLEQDNRRLQAQYNQLSEAYNQLSEAQQEAEATMHSRVNDAVALMHERTRDSAEVAYSFTSEVNRLRLIAEADLDHRVRVATELAATMVRKNSKNIRPRPLEERKEQLKETHAPPRATDLGGAGALPMIDSASHTDRLSAEALARSDAGEVSDVESELVRAAAGTAMPRAAAVDAQEHLLSLFTAALTATVQEKFSAPMPKSMDSSCALGSLSPVSVKKWAREVRNMMGAEGWIQRLASRNAAVRNGVRREQVRLILGSIQHEIALARAQTCVDTLREDTGHGSYVFSVEDPGEAIIDAVYQALYPGMSMSVIWEQEYKKEAAVQRTVMAKPWVLCWDVLLLLARKIAAAKLQEWDLAHPETPNELLSWALKPAALLAELQRDIQGNIGSLDLSTYMLDRDITATSTVQEFKSMLGKYDVREALRSRSGVAAAAATPYWQTEYEESQRDHEESQRDHEEWQRDHEEWHRETAVAETVEQNHAAAVSRAHDKVARNCWFCGASGHMQADCERYLQARNALEAEKKVVADLEEVPVQQSADEQEEPTPEPPA
jgi:hypothetical protein